MHPALLPDLVTGLDKCLQYYATKAKSGCGNIPLLFPKNLVPEILLILAVNK